MQHLKQQASPDETRFYSYLWTSERDDWTGWELVSDDGEWREWRKDITENFIRAFGKGFDAQYIYLRNP